MQSETLLPPVPVRFSKKTKDRVKLTAQRFGLPASEIIRQAVDKQLPIWEKGDELTIKANRTKS